MLAERLPQSILEMADIIGLPNTLAIVALRGGTTLNIPAKENIASHWLIEAIGTESFQKLCWHYSGEEIEIPRCADAIRLTIEKDIISDALYMSHKGLAQKYGYTQRGIRKILAKYRDNKTVLSTEEPHSEPL